MHTNTHTHTHHPCTHARTQTQHHSPKRTSKKQNPVPASLETYLVFLFIQLLHYLHQTVHLFMLLTISGETMCGGHQRTLSNRRLPQSQSKPTAVDRHRKFLRQLRKMPPKASKIQELKKKKTRVHLQLRHRHQINMIRMEPSPKSALIMMEPSPVRITWIESVRIEDSLASWISSASAAATRRSWSSRELS